MIDIISANTNQTMFKYFPLTFLDIPWRKLRIRSAYVSKQLKLLEYLQEIYNIVFLWSHEKLFLKYFWRALYTGKV